ncbi:uncharacterized protein SOCG_00759 [Schizosaccharomyces octosporus yFS286]|uniref:Uncharacterized protein n=1 Tax=Schizosaccharomyces octosporus (strain yFS286) TaxID=483514 RepID=S9PV73_SCHOY|nr:uncharacterized protein SOCG_00759 [Schizosaccharomyces octosporus yFS286]EPX73001.1 hypothetical protein SOCG_00759 [Schizosaccharomyces octosporus yFS286]
MDLGLKTKELHKRLAEEQTAQEVQEKKRNMYLEASEKFKSLENVNGFLLIVQLIYRVGVFFTILSSPDRATLRICIYLEFLVALLTIAYFLGNIVWVKTDIYKKFVFD